MDVGGDGARRVGGKRARQDVMGVCAVRRRCYIGICGGAVARAV